MGRLKVEHDGGYGRTFVDFCRILYIFVEWGRICWNEVDHGRIWQLLIYSLTVFFVYEV